VQPELFENFRFPNKSALLCGIDEAGRGPLAGPVSAAAVILPEGFPLELLKDSKKLSDAGRKKARSVILEKALAWGIGWASPIEIDRINIHKASLLAMKRAFDLLIQFLNKPDAGDTGNPGNSAEFLNIHAIADGLFSPDIDVPCEPFVKADDKVPEVMAASILAKTARDRLMEYYGIFFPEYGYEKHKGYPTKAHREAILRFGPSPIQRMSFNVKL
jgi:ribonuclease HII